MYRKSDKTVTHVLVVVVLNWAVRWAAMISALFDMSVSVKEMLPKTYFTGSFRWVGVRHELP